METLFVLRHGEAEPGGGLVRDHERTLSSKGRQDIERLGAFLQRADIQPSHIIRSPYKRTGETAALISEQLGRSVTPEIDRRITPMGDVGHVCDIVQENKQHNSLLLVTHNPLAALSFNTLCSNGSLRLHFTPGTMCAIHIIRLNPVTGVLGWYLTPDLLKGM